MIKKSTIARFLTATLLLTLLSVPLFSCRGTSTTNDTTKYTQLPDPNPIIGEFDGIIVHRNDLLTSDNELSWDDSAHVRALFYIVSKLDLFCEDEVNSRLTAWSGELQLIIDQYLTGENPQPSDMPDDVWEGLSQNNLFIRRNYFEGSYVYTMHSITWAHELAQEHLARVEDGVCINTYWNSYFESFAIGAATYYQVDTFIEYLLGLG